MNDLLKNLGDSFRQRPQLFFFSGLALLFVLLITYLVLTYSFITVSVGGLREDKTVTIINRSSLERETVDVGPEDTTFRRFVRTGDYDVVAAGGNAETQVLVDVGPLSSNSASLTLRAQKAVTKIANDTEDCFIVAPGKGPLSYPCSESSKPANKHSFNLKNGSTITRAFNGGTPGGVRLHVADGFILTKTNAEEDTTGVTLQYLPYANDTVNSFYNLPSSSIGAVSLHTPSITADDAILAADRDSGSLVHLSSPGANPKVINAAFNSSSLFDVAGSKVAIFTPPDDGDQGAEALVAGGTLTLLSVDGGQARSFDINTKDPVERVYYDGASRVYLYAAQTLSVYDISEDSSQLVSVWSVGSAPTFVDAETIYHISGSGIYQIDTRTGSSQLSFQEGSLRPSALSVVNEKLFFSLIVPDSGSLQTISGYSLDAGTASFPRVESILPYSRDELPIQVMLFVGNQVYVQILLDSYSVDRTSLELSYSQPEFDSKKKLVQQRMTADGLDLNKFEVFFTP